MAEDIKLLREQVDRCRGILAKLTSLGDDQSEILDTMKLSHLIEEVAAPQRAFEVEIEVETKGEGPEPVCRRNPGLLYGLANLVDNAVDFAATVVAIEASWSADQVRIEIRDDGPGFAPEVLLRVGEPYVTTRGAGQRRDDGDASGLGLGLFIAKTLIERSGAQLSFTNASAPRQGAIVRIIWPRTAFEDEAARFAAGGRREPLTAGQSVPI
jgi:two-component system sensor histidine kinase RegB